MLSVLIWVAVMAQVLVAEPTVVVVGGGLAGLSASLEIITEGGRVILVEGENNTGGNSAKASSGINGAGTDVQEKLGIRDSPDLLEKDTLSAGDNENDKKLVKILAENSADAVQFLRNVGVDLTDVNLCGGHSVPRTHWIPSPKEGRPIPAGFEIMKRLRTRLNEIQEKNPESFRLMTQTKMTDIIRKEGKVIGVEVVSVEGEKSQITGDAVILATGGFSADRSADGLLTEYGKDILDFPSTNGPFARGEGVKIARSLGAKLIGMDRIQIHPTAFVDPKDPSAGTKFLAAEALRGKGALLINSDGKRFGNELGRRDYTTRRILNHAKPIEESFQGGSSGRHAAVMLMSEATIDAFGRPAFNFYAIVKKFFVKYNNSDELAKALGVDGSVVKSTLDDYKDIFDKKKEDPFGKKVFPVSAISPTEPIYAAIVVPAIHYTMGGLQIDENARVVDEQGNPIIGLYAAGEVTGGVHGSNRLGGNSLLECVVFGRIAGHSGFSAAREASRSEL
uniref:fumarate reductase (NADH) n=1 Tax=Caenorhabditis tropicalis TaxID=1561998 RepID=A0A1I7TMS0_9PELO